MAKRGKKYRQAAELIDSDMEYTIEEACDLVKKTRIASFNESVDLDLRLGVDPRHADQMVRGSVSLPHGTGRDVRVVVFAAQEDQVKAAQDAGAEAVGAEDLAERILGGWTDFDAAVAAPDMMRHVGRLGKVLGPRGL